MAKAFPGTALTGNLDGTGDDPEQSLLVDAFNHGTLLNALRGSLGEGAWLNLGGGLEAESMGTGVNDKARISFGVVASTGNLTGSGSHRGKVIDFSAAGTFAPLAAGTLGDGWFAFLRHSGTSGHVIIDPNSSETVDGATTRILKPGQSAILFGNASSFRTVGGGGVVVQSVGTQTGNAISGTVIVPLDDSIPTSAEGNEVLTFPVAPTQATNKLQIDVNLNVSNTGGNVIHAAALFQDSGTSAIAVCFDQAAGNTEMTQIHLTHVMDAATTGTTTFKVRVGGHVAGTETLNGTGAARLYGGALSSSLRITEFIP